MDIINLIENMNLIDGLNMNPIPLEFSQMETTTKIIFEMNAKLTSVINKANDFIVNANLYTDEEIKEVKALLYGLNQLQGSFLKDKSVTLSKLSDESISNLNSRIMSYIGSTIKTVQFGLNDEGYFTADIPETWKEINFSTDDEGHLVIETI